MANQSAKQPEDLQLAGRCAGGDRAAQRVLFTNYKALVHSTLFRILGTNRDVEDLVQESFLEIFRSLGSYRGDAKLSTWVARITTRVAFAYISKRKPTTANLEAVPVAADDPSAEAQYRARAAARRLYETLERLNPKYRIAFALHVVDGRSLKEVAAITESSLVATKTRVWRARREVEKRARKDPMLAEYMGEQEVPS